MLVKPTPTREDLLDEILWVLAETFAAEVVGLATADPLGASVDVQASIGLIDSSGPLPDADLIMESVRSGQPLRGPVQRAPGRPGDGVAVPLGDGSAVLLLGRAGPDPFGGDGLDLLCVMGRHIAAVLAQGRRTDRLALLGEPRR